MLNQLDYNRLYALLASSTNSRNKILQDLTLKFKYPIYLHITGEIPYGRTDSYNRTEGIFQIKQ